MSKKYKHGDHVPTEVLCARLDELADAVTKNNMHEFVMRIPAELDRDADLVLSQAASRLREYAKSHLKIIAAEIEKLNEGIK